MWLHEVERIGFARCSRTSALLRAGSDCCTLAAIALLIAAFAAGFSAWYAAAVWLAGCSPNPPPPNAVSSTMTTKSSQLGAAQTAKPAATPSASGCAKTVTVRKHGLKTQK
jgi:hypothetical protein